MKDHTELVRRLEEESQRLSGFSLDHGSSDAGIAANVAREAADAIAALVLEVESMRGETFKASADAAEYHRDNAISMWDRERSRAQAAEAKCEKLEAMVRELRSLYIRTAPHAGHADTYIEGVVRTVNEALKATP